MIYIHEISTLHTNLQKCESHKYRFDVKKPEGSWDFQANLHTFLHSVFLYSASVLVYIYYRSLSLHIHTDVSTPSALPGPASHSRYLRNATDEDDGERVNARGLSPYTIHSADSSPNDSLCYVH